MKESCEHRPALRTLFGCLFWLGILLPTGGCAAQEDAPPPATATPQAPAVDDFLTLLGGEETRIEQSLVDIEANWHPGNRVMLVEVLRFAKHPSAMQGIVELLEKKTNQRLGRDFTAWYRLIWNDTYDPHPHYAKFKARLYSQSDARFAEYFAEDDPATIRLDEIRWGGVRRDGIPPLKDPQTITAAQAHYLADSDVVFGVVVDGEARAYPKRILAWHEMVKDTLGGRSINGVYCTLCGSMIVYFTGTNDGTHYDLGTSGFLYRSNKLMYDHATKSMWSTIEGKPVVGELVGKDIRLTPHSVVTTTWGDWRTRHPDTRVLSLETGHLRDYGEGVAYQKYFATDNLMFGIPKLDRRLKNKDEVFIVRAPGIDDDPLAISVAFLRVHSVYHARIGETNFVVITDDTGANRAYATAAQRFENQGDSDVVIDVEGRKWSMAEEALVSPDAQTRLSRLPAHRAFWFGWHAAQPRTRLVK